MITEISHLVRKKEFKGIARCLKSIFPPRFSENIVFKKNHGRWINYSNPKLLDEKLLILRGKEYYKNPLITKCADKYAVREYIKSKGYSTILTNIIDVCESTKEIDWDKLPKKFVMKCNHGSGYNIIVKDKSNINKNEVISRLNYWMKENYAVISAENQYSKIPRKIIIEEFIETDTGELPIDYKFFCSRGNFICALIITGREGKQERIYVDENFKDLHLIDEYTGDDYTDLMPKSFYEMIKISKVLSEDFPFVRVDLYNAYGKAIFGELTFTPHGCNHDYLSKKSQKWIGNRIII